MTRLPWEHGPAHRTHDDDGGESLNADVMRFVAILALCLVALFALVRSIPLAAPVVPAEPPPAIAPVAEASPQRVVITPSESESPSAPTEPAVSPPGDQPTAPPVVSERRAQTAPATPQSPATPPAASEGFSLRFQSDEAMQRLITDGRVRVYARPEGGRWWVTASTRLAQFQPAAAPVQVYEMAPSTVPDAMLEALGRDRGLAASGPVLWGVRLPPDMEARIAHLVAVHEAGRLIITAGGGVDFDPRR